MFEETKKLLQHAQDTNATLSELSDQRSSKPPLALRILTAVIALSCLAALVVAAIVASR